MSETLEQMEARHHQELQTLRRDCEHRQVMVLQGVGGMFSLIGSNGASPGGCGYQEFSISCKDCGCPLVSWNHGKLSVFVVPDYISAGIIDADEWRGVRNEARRRSVE